jgi:hypothetical protein
MLQVFYLLNQSIWIDHLKLPVDGLQYVWRVLFMCGFKNPPYFLI